MKKIIFILLLLASVVSMNLKANPVIPGPATSELYFINNDWQLELYFEINLVYFYGINSSDSLFLITSTDTARFKPGWVIGPDFLIVITKDSLLSSIPINKNGDYIYIAFMKNGQYVNLDIGSPDFCFGNYPGALVTAPLPGQSIKRISSCAYILVKDISQTIGYDPDIALATASVEGYIYDANHNPFPNASLWEPVCFPNTIFTDVNGHFQYYGIYACNHLIYAHAQFCNYPDTSLIFEPDSTYQLDFILSCIVGTHDYSKTTDYSLQVFPNPGSGNFTFTINAPRTGRDKQLIKIFNAAGELMNMIPVTDIHSETVSVPWNGKGKYTAIPTGMYNCALEINGHAVATAKLVIDR
jgi:hypothetical protein